MALRNVAIAALIVYCFIAAIGKTGDYYFAAWVSWCMAGVWMISSWDSKATGEQQ